jgi:hypothetical protein
LHAAGAICAGIYGGKEDKTFVLSLLPSENKFLNEQTRIQKLLYAAA